MKYKELPLRTGVGIAILNSENKVFVGKRKDNPFDKWQMPQGGVDPNETLLVAMRRELEEETSIKNIKVLKEFDQWLEYELPENLIGKEWKWIDMDLLPNLIVAFKKNIYEDILIELKKYVN